VFFMFFYSFLVFYRWFLRVTSRNTHILRGFIDVNFAKKSESVLENLVFYEGLFFKGNNNEIASWKTCISTR
jgi:high-affinity Fe2+/Pb2+ permease